MKTSRRLSSALALAVCSCLVLAGSAEAASIWTPVTSGTAQTISAIATPKAGEVVYTTTAGEIHYLSGSGAFATAALSPTMSLAFEDIAMSPDGSSGVAVGEGGKIYRSTNSGVNWTEVTGLHEYNGPCGGSFGALVDPLYSVHYASANVVYVTGADNDILKSTNGGATFTEVNKNGTSCVAAQTFDDSYWRDANTGSLLSGHFGELWRSTDGLGGGSGATSKIGEAGGLMSGARLAVDADDPLRLWAVNPEAGLAHFQYSTNAGATWQPATLTDGSPIATFTDIASGVGTNVVAVGEGGAIYTSVDGTLFSPQRAPAPDETTAWEAVAFQPGSTIAWAGGPSGALVSTTQSNAQPAAPPAPSGGSSSPPSPASPSSPIAVASPKRRPALCTVPKLDGKTLEAARRKVAGAHCKLGKVSKREGATAKDGKVAKQAPRPGKKLPSDTKVTVTLAP